MRIFKNRDIDKLVLVDNAVHSYIYQIYNGVPVIPYYKNKNDNQLIYLQHYLMQMKEKDIMTLNKDTFKYNLYYKELPHS